ncbi:MAG: hypothetical protein WBC22_06145 [Sedimentisphaerales bacterium]
MVIKKVRNFILRLLIGVAIVLLIWYLLVNIAFVFGQGQDPEFDFGDNYTMSHLRIYYSSPEEREYYPIGRNIIGEQVRKFALSNPWFIGYTEKGWFAIQKKLHEVHYPISKEKLHNITGLNLSSINMERNPGPYLIVRPQALAAKAKANRFCWILLFVVPLIFGFAPYAHKAMGAKWKNREK